LVAAFQHVDQDDAWRTHRTIYAESFHGSAVGTDRAAIYDQNRDLAYLQYQSEPLRLSLSYQFQGEDFERVRRNWRREESEVEVNTLGLSAQLTSPSPVGTLTYGAEYYRDWVQSAQVNYNSNGTVNAVQIQGPVADDATYDLAGVYLQDQLDLPARWQLILGGRYNYARAEAGQVRDPVSGQSMRLAEDWHSVVGSARLQWQADRADHWRFFGGVSQGFRAPNLSDLTRLDIARSNEVETAAPGLDPERFIAFELGTKARYEKVRAELAYYYTLIEDMIVRQPTGNTVDGSDEVTKRNSGTGYLHGLEATADWQFHPQLKLFGWVSWMEGELDGYPTSAPTRRREYLSRVMPLTVQLGLRWEAPTAKLWAEAVSTLADEADKLSAADRQDTQRIPPGGTPGYGVLTLRAGWRIHPQFSVSAACENLFDKTYRVHGSGVNEAERNFVLAAAVQF
jgi:hemoglobin/transferrin/lactoferrin receptor protein